MSLTCGRAPASHTVKKEEAGNRHTPPSALLYGHDPWLTVLDVLKISQINDELGFSSF